MASLTTQQLENYNLETLFSIHPENEDKFVSTEDIWQIAAFADLFAMKITQTSFPNKEYYERAKRLYIACLHSGQNNKYFERKLADLEWAWKEKTK